MTKLLAKNKLEEFTRGLAAGRDLYAPVEADGAWEFCRVDAVGSADFPLNTRMPPKAFLFPQSERLLAYRLKDGSFEAAPDVPELERERVLFGVRPCDAKSFAILDRLFINDDYVDPYYKDKRDKTLVISLACAAPAATCFCTGVDAGPFDADGADVLLVDVGDSFVADALTDRGKKLIKKLPDADAEHIKKRNELKAAAEARINAGFELAELQPKIHGLFDAEEFWKEVAARCLGCGTCTYLCPTCHCFDIQDETVKKTGERVRNWDTCMSPLFTIHGSGHQPRAEKFQRWRQRVMHKFDYYPENFGVIACVGCGRCVRTCPVNVDLREVLRGLAQGS
jgi:ferredoxin